MHVAILGALGYTGAHLTEEAVRRGHTVTAVSRSAATAHTGPDVTARAGSVTDAALVDELAAEADVLVLAVPALLEGTTLAALVPDLLATVERHATRLGVVGGAGSLLTEPGGPRLVDAFPMPDHVRPGSLAQADLLDALRGSGSSADWFYLSPAGSYGRRAPGERTGAYRVGGDVLLTDAQGASHISGADYALAFVDELEKPRHVRQRFTVAY